MYSSHALHSAIGQRRDVESVVMSPLALEAHALNGFTSCSSSLFTNWRCAWVQSFATLTAASAGDDAASSATKGIATMQELFMMRT